jgi:hypothetical protein
MFLKYRLDILKSAPEQLIQEVILVIINLIWSKFLKRKSFWSIYDLT